jgi:hypothetical protein
MKIVIKMQSPTAIWQAIYEAAAATAEPGESPEALYERRGGMCKILDKYVAGRARVNIEFDLDEGTARLIPLEEQYEPQKAATASSTPPPAVGGESSRKDDGDCDAPEPAGVG